MKLWPHCDPPGLLVSVRSAAEALAALAGGANVIDVKEPARGPLGAADTSVVGDVVRAVAGRVTVTMAAGELVELPDELPSRVAVPRGVSLVKVGLARCGAMRDWQSRWQQFVAGLRIRGDFTDARAVAVVYADWRAADAPHPDEIRSAALDIGCPALLIDTWDKSAGTLLDHLSGNDLMTFVERVRSNGQITVLAGSLSGAKLLAAAQLRPHFVAVRGAACRGGRNGQISAQRVRSLRHMVASVAATQRRTV